jgi:hypothetical protein
VGRNLMRGFVKTMSRGRKYRRWQEGRGGKVVVVGGLLRGGRGVCMLLVDVGGSGVLLVWRGGRGVRVLVRGGEGCGIDVSEGRSQGLLCSSTLVISDISVALQVVNDDEGRVVRSGCGW